ncbi:MAG: PTS sugar transporter subunit IIA [Tissierellia bacterium]|nr:PTS sugar transporter subunit IIA [Tissierellia bacterium]
MIRKELIFLDENINSKNEAMEYISKKVRHLGIINNEKEYLSDLLKRDRLAPTSVGYNIAIPHCKSKSIKNSFVVYLRTKKSFIWDKRNNEQVNSIFFIGVPDDKDNIEHLKLLADLSKKLMHKEFRSSLYRAKDINSTYEILKK